MGPALRRMPRERWWWLPGMAAFLALQTAAPTGEPAAKDAEKTAYLNVRLVDDKGQPQHDAMVHLRLTQGNACIIAGKARELWLTVKCNEDGWATFGPVEPGGGYCAHIIAQKERYAGLCKWQNDQALKAGRNEQVVTYSTPVGSRVSGVLVGKDGQPLEGVTVRLAPRNWCGNGKVIPSCSAMRVKPTCTTDARGAFSFEGLKPAENWAVIAVCGLDILFLGPSCQIPPGGRLELGRIATIIDHKDVKAGPD